MKSLPSIAVLSLEFSTQSGIDGVGVTRGMYKQRTDDHFMLKSELVWNIEKAD